MLVAMVRDRREGRLGPRPGVRRGTRGLGRRARLRGDDEERPQRIEVVEDRVRRRPGRSNRGSAARGSPRSMPNVRRRTSGARLLPPMPATIAVVKPSSTTASPKASSAGICSREVLRGIEPAEALRDGLGDPRVGGPQADVAGEQAARPVLGPGSFDRCLVRGGAGSECEPGSGDGGRYGVGHRGLRAWFSMVRRRTPRGPCDFVDAAPHGVPWRRREAPVRPPDRPRRPPSRGPWRAAGGAVARR